MPVRQLALGASFASLATVAVAAGLATWSPIACGCLSARDALAGALNFSAVPSNFTPSSVEKAVKRTYAGHKVRLLELPGVNNCAQLQPALFRCTYWLWERPSWEKGLEVTIVTSPTGIFSSATVLEALRRGSPPPPP
jgi:hypothetical protein